MTKQRLSSAEKATQGGASALRLAFLCTVASLLAGCSSQIAPSLPASDAKGMISDAPPAQLDTRTLDSLWQERQTERKDLPIGPGDVLLVSVPNVKELDDRTARVDGEGNIMLPLLGLYHVGGLTEPEIVERLTEALHKYAYHPEVNLLAKTYSSRVVGVMGAVRTPGLYVLNGPSDTVSDLMERAGGLGDGAAHEVLLSPATLGRNLMLEQQAGEVVRVSEQAENASSRRVMDHDSESLSPGTNTASPNEYKPLIRPADSEFDHGYAYTISLDETSPSRKYANFPVRPGDTLFVPLAGHVSVIGWVYHPAVLPVTPGLTTLNAVSAAGGLMFAADPRTITIMRRMAGQQTLVMHVDLTTVQEGKAADVELQANDVVEVGYSAVKIPGYAVYLAAHGVASMAPAAAIMSGF
jgi:protein involved in polysaccharide export with SLBB domain